MNKISLSISLLGILLPAQAKAVGERNEAAKSHKEFGANRRVISPRGYGGISGKFSKPQTGELHLKLGPKPKINKTTRLPEKNAKTGETIMIIDAISKDVPQMYMGITDEGLQMEVDAGITFADNFPKSAAWEGIIKNGYWTLFLRASKFILPEYNGDYAEGWDPDPAHPDKIRNFQIPTDAPYAADFLSSPISIELLDQGVKLALKNGTFVYGRTVKMTSDFLKSDYAKSVRVKRVVAMTQSGDAEYNGSSMTGVTFSSGQIRPLGFTTATKNYTLGASIDWSKAMEALAKNDNEAAVPPLIAADKILYVGNSVTATYAGHFIPSGKYGDAEGKQRWVIETDLPRQDNGKPNASLEIFDNETVSIRLNKSAAGKGDPAVPAG